MLSTILYFILLFLFIVHSFSTHIQAADAEWLKRLGILQEYYLEQERQKTQQMTIEAEMVAQMDIRVVCAKSNWAPLDTESSQRSQGKTDRLRSQLGTTCYVCGFTQTENTEFTKNYNKVKMARLLPSSGVYSMPELHIRDHTEVRNYLALCGTKDDDVSEGDTDYRGKPSCHSLFDYLEMSFIPSEGAKADDCKNWKVVGGPLHGEQVTLHSNPHRFVLYAHLEMCVAAGLDIYGLDKEFGIRKWLKGVHNQITPQTSPPPSPEKDGGSHEGEGSAVGAEGEELAQVGAEGGGQEV